MKYIKLPVLFMQQITEFLLSQVLFQALGIKQWKKTDKIP